MVGTFYAAPDPESPPFVKVGDHVGPETTVCIVEAMKVFNQIPAEVSGRIIAVLVENGAAGRVRAAAVQSRYRRDVTVFKRILVANRGEIALRIFRACRELGIETVAIFSEADRGAAYLELADEAYCVGPPKAADSYLKIDRVISAAEIGNVQAIHPGYGFLAENAHFAEVCRSCEIEFIGPTHEAMALVGDKNAARKLAQRGRRAHRARQRGPDRERGPGRCVGPAARLSGADQGLGRRRRARHARGLERSGPEVGLPAGPGRGRGRLRQRRNLPGKIRRASPARRGPGHRRPSRQRRAPLGARLHDAAAAPEAGRGEPRPAARPANPHGDVRSGRAAGASRPTTPTPARSSSSSITQGNFYFIEMNARIQVEHPVTEMVTGIDLIKAQIRVAAGEPLPFRQEDIRPARRGDRVPHQRRRPGEELPPHAGHDHADLRVPAGSACGSIRTSTRATSSRRTTIR